MSDYTLLVGDALEQLRTLPSDSVHVCITSPPYFGLRDYGTATWEGGDAARGAADCDHMRPGTKTGSATTLRNDGREHTGPYEGERALTVGYPYRSVCGKCGARRVDQQIGLEAEPSEFIDKLVAVFREVRRVLHPTGQLFVNIGDTRSDSREWLGIPHRLVFALQDDGWRWEDEVIWAKKAPMPGSQTNRFTRAHEYVFMLNKSRDAFFDSEAVKEPNARIWGENNIGKDNGWVTGEKAGKVLGREHMPNNGLAKSMPDPSGRIRRSVWTLGPEPYHNAHYAVMPSKLVEPCVLAGSSAYGVCSAKKTMLKLRDDLSEWQREISTAYLRDRNRVDRTLTGGARWDTGEIPAELREYFEEVEVTCGSPWQRVVEHTRGDAEAADRPKRTSGMHSKTSTLSLSGNGSKEWAERGGKRTTLGWQPTCTCGADVVPSVVLDPFCGSGTTLQVALKFGRRAIGIDLDARNMALVHERISKSQPMLLTEVL